MMVKNVLSLFTLLESASSSEIPLGLHSVAGKVSWAGKQESFRAMVMVYTGATADVWSYDGEHGTFRADFSKQAVSQSSTGSAESPVGEVSSSLRAFPIGVLTICLGLTGGVSAHGFVTVRVAVAVMLALVALTVAGVQLHTEATGEWKVDVSANDRFAHQKATLALDVKKDGSFSASPKPWFSIPSASATGTVQTVGATMVPEIFANLATTVTDEAGKALNISDETVNGKKVTAVYRAHAGFEFASWDWIDHPVPFVCWTFEDGSSTRITFWGTSPRVVRLTGMNGGCLGGSEGVKTDYKTSWTTTPPPKNKVAEADAACSYVDHRGILSALILGSLGMF